MKDRNNLFYARLYQSSKEHFLSHPRPDTHQAMFQSQQGVLLHSFALKKIHYDHLNKFGYQDAEL